MVSKLPGLLFFMAIVAFGACLFAVVLFQREKGLATWEGVPLVLTVWLGIAAVMTVATAIVLCLVYSSLEGEDAGGNET